MDYWSSILAALDIIIAVTTTFNPVLLFQCSVLTSRYSTLLSVQCNTISSVAFIRSSSNLECSLGHTCHNEDQVRWSITPKVINGYMRQFTSGLVHFWASVHDSAPISRPILIKFGTYIHFAKNKNSFFR